MNIIQHGNKKRGMWWLNLHFCCTTCGCVFQVNEYDGVTQHDDQRNGEYVETLCPECSAGVTVSPL
jgi:hypothetical protein